MREQQTQAYKKAREDAILQKPPMDTKSTQTAASDCDEPPRTSSLITDEKKLEQSAAIMRHFKAVEKIASETTKKNILVKARD